MKVTLATVFESVVKLPLRQNWNETTAVFIWGVTAAAVDKFNFQPQRPQSPISIRVSYQKRSDTLPKDQSAQRNGRYVKNVSSTASNNHRAISRRTYDLSTKQIPENKRALMQVSFSILPADMPGL